jgi:hypothetical protein
MFVGLLNMCFKYLVNSCPCFKYSLTSTNVYWSATTIILSTNNKLTSTKCISMSNLVKLYRNVNLLTCEEKLLTPGSGISNRTFRVESLSITFCHGRMRENCGYEFSRSQNKLLNRVLCEKSRKLKFTTCF